VVTAEAGRLGSPPLLAIQDGDAGIVVRLPDDAPSLRRGQRIEATGMIAQPYGQLELRAEDAWLVVLGEGTLPSAAPVSGLQLDERAEGRLVTLDGLLDANPTKATSGDIALYLVDDDGRRVRLAADGSSGLTIASFTRDAHYRIVGIAGQRASRRGALDGYRIWLRDAADVRRLDEVASTTGVAGSSPGPSGPASSGAAALTGSIPIARAIVERSSSTRISGVVTVGPTLLDSSGRRIVVEDESGAIEVWLPAAHAAVSIGDRLEIAGAMTRAYGAPRIRATTVTAGGRTKQPTPAEPRGALGTAHEWRLVRIVGRVATVRRLGSRWTAEIVVGATRGPVIGLAGAAIPSTTLQEGRNATVVGIARRPYPSAVDRRFAVVPRAPGDLILGPSTSAVMSRTDDRATPSASTDRSPSRPGAADRRPWDTTGSLPSQVQPLDVDLGELAEHVDAIVRVGGLVVTLEPGAIVVDDGTARGRVVLAGEATAYLPLIEPDDAINATGRVVLDGGRVEVSVTDPGGLVRVGDLGEPISLGPASAEAGVIPAGAVDHIGSDAYGTERAASIGGPATPATGPRSVGIALAAFEGPVGLGVAWLALASVVSVGMAALRRYRRRRGLATRIADRLSGVTAQDQTSAM
jgi:hypothetical protein